jgi:polo-like kinase 1
MRNAKAYPRDVTVPETLIRRRELGGSVVYKRHEELGRGGFAAVYRVTNDATGEDFALKAISRERVAKPKSLEKLKTEVSIQRSLNHPNIARSIDSFEDVNNYYIVLELCPGHSVRDRVKRCGHLSESETRSILRDVIAGVCYLHDNHIIHRDLKLENFLVGGDGKVKIADFGLSAKLDYDDERKYTVCGTPNYLSPELLVAASKGHSYEVDIWTIGVCAFAMLTGRPPFETARTKLTYEHIKSCQYKFPTHLRFSEMAMDFVRCILQLRPECRPSAQDLAMHPFISGEQEPLPAALRAKIDAPKYELPERGMIIAKPELPARKKPEPPAVREENLPQAPKAVALETAIAPVHCVSRFCDHSDKYGLGYMLIDGTIGACFNDLTRMVMDPHEGFVQYWESYETVTPEVMEPNGGPQAKKLSLLLRFGESLKKTRSMFELPARPYSQSVPLHHVKYWMRNDEATLFRMDDRNIQVNFNDRFKVVIFWNTKKMTMVKNIRDSGNLVSLADLTPQGPLVEEYKKFSVAKAMLAEMSGR